jgi:hypothetical protein
MLGAVFFLPRWGRKLKENADYARSEYNNKWRHGY